MKKLLLIMAVLLIEIPLLFGQVEPQQNPDPDSLLLSEALSNIEESSGYHFYYRIDWLESKYISKEYSRDLTLEKLIGSLSLHGFNVHREGDHIYILPKKLIFDLPDYAVTQKAGVSADTEGEEEGSSQDYISTTRLAEQNYFIVGDTRVKNYGKYCKIKGTIVNRINEEGLIGATIQVQENKKATISDVNGDFLLQLKPGEYTLSVNHVSMKPKSFGVRVYSDGDLLIGLDNEIIEIEEIVVVDERHDHVRSMNIGFEKITSKVMKEVPNVMGERDILKVAQLLPGVQNVGEGSSGFNVRGGSTDQNMFYINDISVYNTSHLFGFFTSFSPDIIEDFTLYKTNVPARYGGRISSVFEINTRDGSKDKFFAQGGLSPVTGHLSIEGPVIKEKVSFVASIRSTYSDWLLKRIDNMDLQESNASFNDATLSLDARLNDKNTLKLFYYRSKDVFSLSSRNDYDYSTSGGSINFINQTGENFSSKFSLASSNYTNNIIDKNNISEAYSSDYIIEHTEARADFQFTGLAKHRIDFGLNSILYNLESGSIRPYGPESTRVPVEIPDEAGIESSVYLSDEIGVLDRLKVLVGLRYSVYSYLGPTTVNHYLEGVPKSVYSITEQVDYSKNEAVKTYSGLEPRIAFNFMLPGNNSIKVSYNRLNQYIFLLSNTIAVAPTDRWKLTDYHISPVSSDQLSAGYFHAFKEPGVTISAEIYAKQLKNVLEYKDGADFISEDPIETLVLQGDQDSKGVELMVKRTRGDLNGWMSYTYSRSIVQVDNDLLLERINGGDPYPSNYDRPHSFNLVANYDISRRVSISSNIVYMSGRPITLPTATFFAEGERYPIYSRRNAYRIPDYFRIDFSLNVEGNLKNKKVAHSYWMFSIYNLTGRDNAYSVFYEKVGYKLQGYKLSIFAQPIFTISWNFKLGNYNSNL